MKVPPFVVNTISALIGRGTATRSRGGHAEVQTPNLCVTENRYSSLFQASAVLDVKIE